MRHTLITLASATLLSLVAGQGLTNSSLQTFVDAVTLTSTFDPVKPAYWTSYVHHRRTPFAVSPSGNVGYLAYLDSSGTGVHIQSVDTKTFAATGTTVTVAGTKEAGGLVAHDDGFALLTNEPLPSGTATAPPASTPVAVLYRFDASGQQKWKTYLGGPTIANSMGHMSSPDLNGDLVYSNVTNQYAAYFVVTAYDGDANGHFGDSIRYVSGTTGAVVNINGASSDWGCSHNTGIALEAADAAPYASVCAEDQGAIWFNTKGQGMYTESVKVSNENTTNGADGEPMGGMSGSYSNLARFQGGNGYIFAWVSRGAVDLTENTWMGQGYTNARNRTNGRNVAIATFTDKYTMVQKQASSTVGAASGDSQVNWITTSTKADQSNAHAATFDGTNALVTWEEIANPLCEYIAFGCRGTFTGSRFQLVSNQGNGAAVGAPLSRTDVTVSGDLVTMNDGRICWPYVNMKWDLSPVADDWNYKSTTVTKMSFACMSQSGTPAPAVPAPSASASVATSAPVVVASSVVSSVVKPTTSVSSAIKPTKSSSSVVKPAVTSSSVSSVIAVPSSSAAASSVIAVTSSSAASVTSVIAVPSSSAAISSTIAAAVSSSSFSTAAAVATSSNAPTLITSTQAASSSSSSSSAAEASAPSACENTVTVTATVTATFCPMPAYTTLSTVQTNGTSISSAKLSTRTRTTKPSHKTRGA